VIPNDMLAARARNRRIAWVRAVQLALAFVFLMVLCGGAVECGSQAYVRLVQDFGNAKVGQ